MLTLQRIPTASNRIADATSRPSRDTVIRLQPEAFWAAWTELGPLNIDLMAPTSVFCSALLVDPVRFRFSLITIGRVLLAWTSSHKMSRESGAGEHPSGYLLPSAR